MFQPGDRVRWASIGDDGFPIVRYGFVRGANGDRRRVAVMLDGDLKGDTVVDLDQLEAVTITNIELHLSGTDLLDDASLRQGIVNLWTAEADQAGLEVRSLEYLGHKGWGSSDDGCALAELRAGGAQYILRAIPRTDDSICVKADLPLPGET
ncbi:MAG: hypothetical protein R8G01_06310 [Ilumatobacteraceae bacterium]|nr:hypothetical protein [Ilumatobacteraceae bacterium]